MKRLLFTLLLLSTGLSFLVAQNRSEKHDREFPDFIHLEEKSTVAETSKLFEKYFLLDAEDEL